MTPPNPPELPGSFPACTPLDHANSSVSLPTVASPYVSKETFAEHDSPLLHQRITSELRRERESIPRKHLRRHRVLVGCLTLTVQVWVAFLTGRYLIAFLQDSSPLSPPASSLHPPTKLLSLVCLSLSAFGTASTLLLLLFLRYIHHPPSALPHPRAAVSILRTFLILVNVLGLVAPAAINVVLIVMWRRESNTCATPHPVGLDVLWIDGDAFGPVCLVGDWKWIVAGAGRLVATLVLLGTQTSSFHLLLPHLLIEPSPASILPQHTPIEYEEDHDPNEPWSLSQEELAEIRVRSQFVHAHHDHPGHEDHRVPERHSWWNGGGERIEYLETSEPEIAPPPVHEEQSWRSWAFGPAADPVEPQWDGQHTRRSSVDSTSSGAPLMSHHYAPSTPDILTFTPAPPPSPARRAGRWMRGRTGPRRELSNVESVGSDEEDVYEDALSRREGTERSERAHVEVPGGWRGEVQVGMGR